ncbi:MAG TPA: type II secretion system major pseudopilin GspG [Verrucomicrobiales bacterium]|nr:type II secretion system major pseudopilin GspG [Verrucomicrobiales bacterium]
MKIRVAPHSRRSLAAGFTLIEMVLVLAIIALLIGAGVMKLSGVLTTGQETTARMDLGAVESALRMYQIDSGFLPTTEQGLGALVNQPSTQPIPKRWKQQVKEIPIDPWGNPYQYRRPGLKNSDGFDLWSWGKDGIESNDDIGNWE